MADEHQPGNGGASESAAPDVQAQVVGQYIKDLSFENPSIGKPVAKNDEQPNLEVQINVNAKRLNDEHFESAIEFKALASNSEGTIYDLELVYAGLFRVQNLPEEALEPFLLIHCPTLTFPFLCRLVADLTREGGFPPLFLDPVDFAALYNHNKQADPKVAEKMN